MITTIVPVYNSEKWLRRCLDSILSQTYGDIEVILVDDGSTDGSQAICDEYVAQDSRVRVMHQKNQGALKARLNALPLARGEWVSFIDSDDWLEKDMYERMMGAADEKTGIVWCDVTKDLPEGGEEVCEFNIPGNPELLIENLFNGRLPGWMHHKLIRKSLLTDQKVNMEGVYQVFEDVVWTLQLLLLSPEVAHVARPLYHYNLTNDSALTSGSQASLYLKAFPNIEIMDSILRRRGLIEKYGDPFRRYLMEKKIVIANDKGLGFARKLFPQAHKHIDAYPFEDRKLRVAYWLCFNSGRIGEILYDKILHGRHR
ncbi:MAG: glycosyltransferase [Muribaculaceae bacterium]|nr:glycosyltransferase [Muribaculaceae bacterium]